VRVALVLAATLMIIVCYSFQLFGSSCFEPYEVTDTVSDKLGGDVFKMVKPLGAFTLALFGFSLALWSVFGVWVSREMRTFEFDDEQLTATAQEARTSTLSTKTAMACELPTIQQPSAAPQV